LQIVSIQKGCHLTTYLTNSIYSDGYPRWQAEDEAMRIGGLAILLLGDNGFIVRRDRDLLPSRGYPPRAAGIQREV
jgi:hypothetical protein